MSFLGVLTGKQGKVDAAQNGEQERRLPRVLIGVAGFHGVIPECQENFFQLAYRLGRDHPEFDFFLKIIIKREQFRARNNLVDLAIVNDCDYLLMLDDDMVVPPNLFRKLIQHDKEVIGALYYQRGGAYHPVIMRQINKKDGLKGINFINHFDPMITKPGLYKLDGVIGGGCMLFKTDVFRKIPQPYFWIDGIVGTDVHVCNQLLEAGVDIWVDTSIELGHVGEPPVITARNIPRYNQEIGRVNEAFWEDMKGYFCMNDLQLESEVTKVLEGALRKEYWEAEPRDTWEQVKRFYQSYGNWQIINLGAYNLRHDEARAWAINNLKTVLKEGALVDLGCGNGYVTVPLAQKGFHVQALDLDGTPTLDFLRWRLKKHKLESLVSVQSFGDPVPPDLHAQVDAVLCISMFDHLWDPYGTLDWVTRNVKPGGWWLCDSWRSLPKESEPQHLLRFDPYTIQREFRRRGWRETPDNPFLFQKEG